MNKYRHGSRKGFSLVELLAVVLILAVLAAVAIPLYINTRKSSAARACKANITAIATAQAAFALRNGYYAVDPNSAYTAAGTGTSTATADGLVGAPEGLTQPVTCPLDGSAYEFTGGGTGSNFTITCPNAATHATVLGVAGDYARTLPAPATETGP
jgi:type IV pilus assembly protein PilA